MNPDPLLRSIGKLAKTTQRLARQAVAEYAPIVDSILRSRCKNARHIEQTLDGMLGFCFDSNMLLLYKKLCRHYYDIDQSATTSYVNAYRDMWGSGKEGQP